MHRRDQLQGIGGGNDLLVEFDLADSIEDLLVANRFEQFLPRDLAIEMRVDRHLAALAEAFFGDVGLLWNESEEFRSDEVIGGVGISIRPILPFISYLRFDFAYGEPGEGVSFFLGAGNKLNKHKQRNR